jgi:hypothetical protein
MDEERGFVLCRVLLLSVKSSFFLLVFLNEYFTSLATIEIIFYNILYSVKILFTNILPSVCYDIPSHREESHTLLNSHVCRVHAA